jgi:hypothetical protein
MFRYRSRILPVWILCGAAVVLAAPHLTAQEVSSSVKKRGKAVVEYKDKDIQVVAAYNYSQRNHDSRWLYIQTGLTTRDETIIRRDAIALRTPQGRSIPLASQRQVGDDTKRVEQLLQNARVVSHDIPSYFTQAYRIEDMQLFRLPFDRIVHDEFIVDRDRLAVGPLFFASPTGAWEKGTYALVVRHGKGSVELPITLE